MTDPATQAAELTRILGPHLVLRLADMLHTLTPETLPHQAARLIGLPGTPRLRLAVQRALDDGSTAGFAPPVLAALWRAAALAAEQAAEAVRLELVWSGPESARPPTRLTTQAALDVIADASQELLIVCYTLHRIEALRQALVAAVDRGVQPTLVLEDAEGAGDMTLHTLQALAKRRPVFGRYYQWPRERHPDGVQNLHVKCLVADRRTMLLGSANLTKAAMERNMELGVLIRGGPEPDKVVTHFQALIQRGTLRAAHV